MISNKIETTLIQLIPEHINIKSYNPDKLNEYTITICNNCNIPLILSLSSSDSSILLLKDSSIKIGKKQKKAITFMIKDKNFSKNKKNFCKPKKLYIFIKNDLIEEKFEITLSYYSLENTAFSENKNGKNKGFLSFNSKNKNKINSNENKQKKIIPKNIKKVNLIKVIKNNSKNENNEDIFYSGSNDFFNNLNINEDERIAESSYLNNAVQDLRNQILYLKQMLEHSQAKIQKLQIQRDKNYNNLICEKCISFYVNGYNENKLYNKRYIYDISKNNKYDHQNIIMLKEENEKLSKMVNYLKKKIYLYEKQDFLNQNNNYNRNKNFIINNYNYS